MKRLLISSFASLLISGSVDANVSLHAATVELRCPENLVTTEKLEKTPPGFTSRIAETKHYWEAVDFYSGKPQENASLAPTETKTGRLWQFSKGDNNYISCRYHQSKIELFQKLPKNTVSCSILLDMNVQGCFGGIPKKVFCQTE